MVLLINTYLSLKTSTYICRSKPIFIKKSTFNTTYLNQECIVGNMPESDNYYLLSFCITSSNLEIEYKAEYKVSSNIAEYILSYNTFNNQNENKWVQKCIDINADDVYKFNTIDTGIEINIASKQLINNVNHHTIHAFFPFELSFESIILDFRTYFTITVDGLVKIPSFSMTNFSFFKFETQKHVYEPQLAFHYFIDQTPYLKFLYSDSTNTRKFINPINFNINNYNIQPLTINELIHVPQKKKRAAKPPKQPPKKQHQAPKEKQKLDSYTSNRKTQSKPIDNSDNYRNIIKVGKNALLFTGITSAFLLIGSFAYTTQDYLKTLKIDNEGIFSKKTIIIMLSINIVLSIIVVWIYIGKVRKHICCISK